MRLQRLPRHFANLVELFGFSQAVTFSLRWGIRQELIEVSVPDVRTPILVRRFDSDIHVLAQIFRIRECDLDLGFEPRLIIDGGAYVGYSALYFANKYPNAQVVAIEPDSNNCELFRRNCVGYSNIHLIQGGLWHSSTPLVLGNPGNTSWTFQVSSPTTPITGSSVRGVTLRELMESFQATSIDILKLDIEGAEKGLFSMGDLEWIDRTRAILIETHGSDCEEAVRTGTADRGFVVSKKGEKMCLLRA